MAEASRPSAEAVLRLDALPRAEAEGALKRCCGARAWVSGMLALRPFGSAGALHDAAATVFRALGPEDYREAFSHHPDIGADPAELRRRFAGTAELSLGEQSAAAAASEATLLALRERNVAYRERFGFGFIVCATGKRADEMLALLNARFHNPPETELAIAAAEQVEITRLRLEKLT